MQQVTELKIKLADEREKLTALNGELQVMQGHKSAIAEKIASVAADLVAAKTAAQEAAKEFAFGNADEAALTETQTAVMRLEASRAAFEAALTAITEEIVKIEESRKPASDRVERLQDMIYEHITVLELKKAEVFIKRAHRAFCKQKAAYMHRDSFNRDVANLVHHCRHDDSDKISRELSTIYGLDL